MKGKLTKEEEAEIERLNKEIEILRRLLKPKKARLRELIYKVEKL
jgi:hypothetical protein